MGSERQAAQKELSQLIERLRVRLGEGTVLQPRLVESHLPEKAFELREADQAAEDEEKSALSTPGQSRCKAKDQEKIPIAAATRIRTRDTKSIRVLCICCKRQSKCA